MADVTNIYNTALGNWLANQKASQAKYAEAESPLISLQGEFAPGGTWQKGQNLIAEQAGNKAGAAGMSQLVSTGMSSGSLAVGLGSRIASDVANVKTGIEGTRLTNLMDIIKSLAGVRTAAAKQLGDASDPFANTYMNIQGSQPEEFHGFTVGDQSKLPSQTMWNTPVSSDSGKNTSFNFNY
jgi:hypothetical protein